MPGRDRVDWGGRPETSPREGNKNPGSKRYYIHSFRVCCVGCRRVVATAEVGVQNLDELGHVFWP